LIVKNTNGKRIHSITIYQQAGFADRKAIGIAENRVFCLWGQKGPFIAISGAFIYVFDAFIYSNLHIASFVFALHI